MTQRGYITLPLRRFIRLLSVVVLLCLNLSSLKVSAHTPQVTPEYKLKAAFLYNFTRFVEWPEQVFANTTAPIVIGIIGDDPFGSFLDELVSNEKIGNRSIIVRRFAEAKDIADCQLLYITYLQTEKIASVLSMVSNKGVLTINDIPAFTGMGGIVQFYTDKNKIRMMINNAAAKRAGLNISTKLLSVVKVVNQ